MKYILENSDSIKYYTNLKDVFKAIDNWQLEYNWLITEFECNCALDERFCKDIVWISGQELTNIIQSHDIQFIWGVFSGFLPNEAIDCDNLSIIPYANMNKGLWSPHVDIQHPKAEIEIVCWDSTATMILCKDERISKKFSSFYRDAVRLDQMNLKYYVDRIELINSLLPKGSTRRNSPYYNFVSYVNQAFVMYLSKRFEDSAIFFCRAIRESSNILGRREFVEYYDEVSIYMKWLLNEIISSNRVDKDMKDFIKSNLKKMN